MKKRLSQGGLVEHQRPLSFTFNDTPMQGLAGDTIASALLANNVSLVARSFKYHRPRGIYSAGPEEPHAIFTVEQGERHTPNVRATITPLQEGMKIYTQSGYPSVDFDVGSVLSFFSRLMPPGFYYKTFMQPTKLWMWYEKYIRKAASSAPAPTTLDSDCYR
nr:(2Fe-2S)-binding protein [Pseudomonadota bacterium]